MVSKMVTVFFFFSSRRRHTRSLCDWSSDVCSSDLEIAGPEPVQIEMAARGPKKYYELHRRLSEQDARAHLAGRSTRGATLRYPGGMRSEERRVGKGVDLGGRRIIKKKKKNRDREI